MDGYSSNVLFKVLQPDGTSDNNPKRFIPREKCLEILDDCVEMGVGAVQITGGGEPTVHADHPEIFRAVIDRGLDLALVTNGWAMRESALTLVASGPLSRP
jgi:molybdenum cofactor biosynthesis enzyme MoaA